MRKSKTSTTPKSTDIWTRYRVTWRFLTSLCGSVPAAPELVKAWLESRAPDVRAPGGRSISEINEEVLATLAEVEPLQASMLTFQRVNGEMVMRAGTVRAHIKDCARVISAQFVGRIKGERAFSTRVVNGVYLPAETYWIPIQRPDGSHLMSPDGARDKPVHIKGPRGTFNALKRFEYVMPPAELRFELRVLGQSVTEDDLHTLFQYGGVHGYGGERGDGEGRYEYELEAV